MLSYLRIKNFAIIDELEIEFEDGLNVITGETGAGKSIIINSIGALVSSKISRDLLKKDASYGEITAQFFLADKEITIRRLFFPTGRTRTFVDGEALPSSKIEQIGDSLINIYSQNEYQNLLEKEKYLDLLDEMLELSEERNILKENFMRLKEVEARLDKLSFDSKGKEKEIHFLQYQIEEIESLNLKENEEEELKEKLRLLKESERLIKVLSSLIDILYLGENSVSSVIKKNLVELKGLSKTKDLLTILGKLESALILIEEIILDARDILRKIEFEGVTKDKIEERLSKIYLIKEKYGKTVEEIRNYKERAKERIEYLQKIGEEIERLKEEKNEIEKKVFEIAKDLSEKRKNGAKEIERLIMDEFKYLSMKGVELKINIDEKEKIDEKGIDDVDFLISTNPGEPLKPLRKIASGGELSRIMLAIKRVMGKGKPKTLIFDEIDTGIGGRVAELVGKRLKELSRFHQVICITHLPQIAAQGDHHFLVEKKFVEGKTKVGIRKLKEEERVMEIARMISGEKITERSIKKAEEMVKIGQESLS